MTNNSAPSETRGQERSVEALCEEAGFPLARIRREGEVLVLVPKTLASLPGADRLQTLSDRIENFGFRYVAFSVDVRPSDPDRVDKER